MPQFQIKRGTVGRVINIDTRVQKIAGTPRQLAIQLAALPKLSDLKPNGAKGIEQVLAVVLNPVVRTQEENREVIEFDPQLTVTVQYTQADADATTQDAKGVPKLSLALVYESQGQQKWERLKTRVTPSSSGGGTLEAKIKTLQPADPIVVCRP